MFKTKGKGIEFQTTRGKYMMPSKMFPLASKKKDKIKVLHPEITTPLDNPIFEDGLNQMIKSYYDKGIGQSGLCYRNARAVVDVAKALDLDVQFYSGWLFIGANSLPVHHAWALIGEEHVVDIVICPGELMLLNQVDSTNPNWRKEIASKLKNYRDTHNKVRDRVFGKVPEGLVYIGSEDTPDNALNTFAQLSKDFPNHPSYSGGGNMKGQSKLQEEMNK